ncbi:MAG: threonine aldolase family protein, partial [Actinomycetota bacterium]
MPTAPSHLLASDNVAGAHPLVLDAITRANAGHALAYGNDDFTRRAESAFNELFGRDVRTLFVYGGTGANVLALASVLQQAESVICTNWSHIHVDETGAPERVLGAKLLDLTCADGKLTPDQVRAAAGARGNPHHAQPGVVSLTQPTELGTLYSPAEVRAICDAAHECGLLVHMDAARIGNATAALGGNRVALRAFTVDAGVDVLSFGGTKAGIVFGEAVVWFDPRRAHFAIKQCIERGLRTTREVVVAVGECVTSVGAGDGIQHQGMSARGIVRRQHPRRCRRHRLPRTGTRCTRRCTRHGVHPKIRGGGFVMTKSGGKERPRCEWCRTPLPQRDGVGRPR